MGAMNDSQTTAPELDGPLLVFDDPLPEDEPRGDVHAVEVGGMFFPEAPTSLDNTGIAPEVLLNLALKFAHTTAQFDTGLVAHRLHLPMSLVVQLLEQLRAEKLIEVLGGAGPFNYRFRITLLGRERAEWLMAICGYVGPAPVSVHAYTELIEEQSARLPQITPHDVSAAISGLVLTDATVELAGLAVSSGRSLFLYGPPGNGKTTLGRMLHQALQGDLWIPYCIGIENQIIRVFDRHCHTEMDEHLSRECRQRYDRRWVRIRRPLVVVGGELTLAELDLIYDATRRYYEAPLHMKANGGIFLLDDFGCQRTPPTALLNRWIIPLEQRIDYLTLATGQQIQVPFRNMLVVSTNLDVQQVMAPGLLRRMGYRVNMENPSPERYAQVFSEYAARAGLAVPPDLLDWLLARYRVEGRPLRSCEPRDLIERARDICRYRGWSDALTQEVLALAWTGYFGSDSSMDPTEPSLTAGATPPSPTR
jgi:predicted ATPase with chaperone activity